MIDWDVVRAYLADHAWSIAGRVGFLAALVCFGRVVARWIVRAVDRALERHHADASLRRFVCDVVNIAQAAAVILVALDTFGIKTTAVVVVFGAGGLAIGLALQGSLSNFAAGVLLVALRPYRVADSVMLGKYIGRVEAIRVFHTVVVTPDNRLVAIPNSEVLKQPIENLTALGRRRIDLVITVDEVADLEPLEEMLALVAAIDPRIEAAPAPVAELAAVDERGAKLYLRAWTRADAYSDVVLAELARVRAALRGRYGKFSAALAV
ncbi:MAG TPA: mechanosensitive ion channel family protein [Kofleriaceae bacterium]|nr:mechanosensitive ion channel family protein [Kofleriaceae bacterium]